ncbi:MAG: triphosphoribosyl-dephospho-CoA synthase [Paenibacillaceae bacterium]
MWSESNECAKLLAEMAIKALLDEAELTPKPGLVDSRSSGSHVNMNIAMMRASAESLRPCFEAMGRAAYGRQPNQELREELALLGRNGEKRMLEVTRGVNTHRGAIWALGLLLAGAAVHRGATAPAVIAATAGRIANFSDRFAPEQWTNGMDANLKYGVQGARGEALQGFPHVIRIGVPVLQRMRKSYSESTARLHALLAIMSTLQDTCLLHRGGQEALETAQRGAASVLERGGIETAAGWQAYCVLEQSLLERRLSPGGSADLLAAVLLLDSIHSTAS